MWTEDKATYRGRHHQVKDAICVPKPIQKPHPPIWVGGHGRLMLKLAAEKADGINFYGSPSEFEERYKILKRYSARFGRDYDDVKKSWTGEVIIASDRHELGSKIRKLLKIRGTASTPEQYSSRNLTGTPEDIRARIEEYIALGVEYFWPDLEPSKAVMSREDMKIFADDVVKKFQ